MKVSKAKSSLQHSNLRVLKGAHFNKWVAFSSDYKKVLGAGDTLADVLKIDQVDKIVMKVIPKLGYIPSSF